MALREVRDVDVVGRVAGDRLEVRVVDAVDLPAPGDAGDHVPAVEEFVRDSLADSTARTEEEYVHVSFNIIQ
ncbi:hypothetical protein GCM10009000_100760 [Halobacterium noricense]